MPKFGEPIEGRLRDDGFNKKAMENAVGPSGEVNWHAAFAADPGVTQCETCGIFLWKTARVLRCPCGKVVERWEEAKDAE